MYLFLWKGKIIFSIESSLGYKIFQLELWIGGFRHQFYFRLAISILGLQNSFKNVYVYIFWLIDCVFKKLFLVMSFMIGWYPHISLYSFHSFLPLTFQMWCQPSKNHSSITWSNQQKILGRHWWWPSCSPRMSHPSTLESYLQAPKSYSLIASVYQSR